MHHDRDSASETVVAERPQAGSKGVPAATPEPGLNVVNAHLAFPRVTLVEPSTSCFIQIAAEIDARPAVLPGSRRKKRALAECKRQCEILGAVPGVLDAAVFEAVLVPPGRGEFLKKRAGKVRIARYDAAVLVECLDAEAARRVREHPAFVAMRGALDAVSRYTHEVVATNVRRIGPVDHSRPGVFLFNYFFADRLEQNLAVWNYTAGWFQAETGLDNSTVLLPTDPARSQYTIINHCRWDSLRDILPSLIFKKTFRTYVLDNFAANDVAAMPVLYRLA